MLRKLILGLPLLAMSLTFSGCNFDTFLDCIVLGDPEACDVIFGDDSSHPSRPEAAAAKGKKIRYRINMNGAISDRGKARKNGAKTSVKGVALRGAFSGTPSRPVKASAVDLNRFRQGSWNTLLNMSGNSKTRKGGAKGTALETFTDQRAGQMCLRLRIKFRVRKGKPKITGTFKSTGGTGNSARVVAKGTLKYKENPDGTFRASGTATYSGGRARPLPQACQKIKQKFGLP